MCHQQALLGMIDERDSAVFAIMIKGLGGEIMQEDDRETCVCYACQRWPARPRSIGGTCYFLCDECYELHQRVNREAVECLRNRRTLFSSRSKIAGAKEKGSALSG